MRATCPWCVLKTNLHVARDLAGIPKIRLLGTPKWLRVRLRRGCRLRGPGDLRDSVGRDRRRGRARRDRHHRRPRRGRRRRPRRHPPALPARRQVRGLGQGHPVPPAAPRDVLHLRGAGGGLWGRCVVHRLRHQHLHNGNLGGLAGADAICQARAEAAGSLAAPGTYLAWLSDAGGGVDPPVSPSTRFIQASVPYRLVNGTIVAASWSDLVDGSWRRPSRSPRVAVRLGLLLLSGQARISTGSLRPAPTSGTVSGGDRRTFWMTGLLVWPPSCRRRGPRRVRSLAYAAPPPPRDRLYCFQQ